MKVWLFIGKINKLNLLARFYFIFCLLLFLLCILFCYLRVHGSEGEWLIKSYSQNLSYGGAISNVGDNNYRIESRINPFCFVSQVRCNKALISYRNHSKPIEGRKVVFEFDFKIEKYNFQHSPEWWVLFQDWLRINPEDKQGNRPISTIEVKSYGEQLFIRHKDSAFQWGNDPTRTKQITNGQLQIFIGTSYKIRIELIESVLPQKGGMSFYVDDELVSNAKYQTKSAKQWSENVQEFGLYHDKLFDVKRLEENKIVFYISNLKVTKL